MKFRKKLKIIVNAIPLGNITVGIGRYLRCLYTQMENAHRGELDIGYFDGRSVRSSPPRGPGDLAQWSRFADLFWRLPTSTALMIRLCHQLQTEVRFRIAARGYDLYHEAAFFPFASAPNLKSVFTVHDLSLIRFPALHPRERVLFSRLFFSRRCRRADHLVSVSEFTRKELQLLLGVDTRRITVTHLAHDSGMFYPRPKDQIESVRTRFKLPGEYLLMVGTGDPRKNLHLAIRAVRKSRLNMPLVTAGWSGWSGSMGKDGLLALGYVSDEDLACLYSGALAFIYPSIYEGFGIPVLEAMACGCPVISARRASLPEVGGDAALYLNDVSNPDELARLLITVATSKPVSTAMIEAGRGRASRFSWEQTAQRTCSLFQSVAG